MYERNICIFLVSCLLAAGSAGAQSPPTPLTDAQSLELSTYTAQLNDPQRSARTKQEAAALLLTRSYPQAAEALLTVLKNSANQTAQIAIAQAIAENGPAHPDFIAPLVSMLTGQDASVRGPAAKALATYRAKGASGKLTAIALDVKQDRPVRQVATEAMGSLLDKQTAQALITLTNDDDAVIRDAAMLSLAAMTNNQSLGKDRAAWAAWWQRNKDKDPLLWLNELADSLSRSKAALEIENAQLRERLTKAITDLYETASQTQQESMLLSLLSDRMADVRLAGLTLADRRVAGGKELPAAVRKRISGMLTDATGEVRRSAALLAAQLGEAQILPTLLTQLDSEKVQTVRQGLLTALGRLRDPKALPAVLKEMDSTYERTVIAAAGALARIAGSQPLNGQERATAVATLLARYDQADKADDGETLREALITAMGPLNDPAVCKTLARALSDRAATVRLAALNAMAQQGFSDGAETIAPLMGDSDRGVRRAAILALGTLGGQKYLGAISQRTRVETEDDAAVRDQAWSTMMSLLSKADVAVLRETATALAAREDALVQRIKVLDMLVQALVAAKSPQAWAVQREMGEALMKASRAAEAAVAFEKAHKALLAAGDAQARPAWRQWVEAMILADDVSAVKAMAEQTDAEAFQAALEQLNHRMSALNADGKFDLVVLLARQAVDRLAQRLTSEQLKRMQNLLALASAKQRLDDQQRVRQLLGQMLGGDESAAKAAEVELQNLGPRAVKPLVEAMAKSISDDGAKPESEKTILALLARLAPHLKGYDIKASRAERLKVIDGWKTRIGP
ncbi:MAG: HEAT repeat domain-containing protein [Planctomycetaceae bacterium]|nr:HEAT repeat domain-containing protein [Planctomycetaceae bacterium]